MKITSEHRESLERRVAEWTARIDARLADARAARADVEDGARRRLDELREKRDRLAERMRRLRETGAGRGAAVREKLEAALEDVRAAFREAGGTERRSR